ncbi:MAG: cpdA [Thermoleophilia bacterium]|nr:cpdA [Thermoleophilia bacterium]
MVEPADGPVDLLVQLTDLHVQVGPGDAVAAARVADAIALVAALDPQPVGVLLSGDLVNSGSAAEYGRLVELLAPLAELGHPLLPLVGNHDDRELLREAFAGVPGTVGLGAERHLQYVAQLGSFRVVCLDTQHTGFDDGKLCDTRQAWLEAQLAAAPGPTIIAMHHPPVAIGMPRFDGGALRPDHALRLRELLDRSPQVERIVCGHQHQAVTAMFGRVPVFVCPSVFHPGRPDMHPEPLALVEGPVGVGVHVRTVDGGLASHARIAGPPPLGTVVAPV